MQFEGDMDLALPRAHVWEKLKDVRFLVSCIPDTEEVSDAREDGANCTIKPGFSFVRGSLHVAIDRAEMAEPERLKYVMKSKGIGTTSEVQTSLGLTDAGSGTRVHWVAEITSLGGLLKAAPKGLIRGAAQKVITDVWARVKQKLEGQGG